MGAGEWIDIALAALVLGLLIKTNLIEDRVKELGGDAQGETEGREGDARDESRASLDGGADDPTRP